MSEKSCATCPNLANCIGKNLFKKTPEELIDWCIERKKYRGLKNAEIAELAGLSQGTVDGLLSKQHNDFRYSTMHLVLTKALISEWDDGSCPEPDAGERAEYERQLAEKQAEIDKLKLELEIKNEHLITSNQRINNFRKRDDANQKIIHDVIRNQRTEEEDEHTNNIRKLYSLIGISVVISGLAAIAAAIGIILSLTI